MTDDFVCTKCGSKNTVRIVYGYPSEKTLVAAKYGKVILGGCIISNNDPAWYCNDCQNQWGNREDYDRY
ncbi:MAG: hypothetical protein FJ356_06155 [Thaumarchaeota archaeon]|nr:hypothetical protein [Nitrososphaerota archaeon]